jgi:hypothetical protein
VEPGSFNKLNYLLRPAKQIERKLLIEGLTKMGKVGYPIDTYTYLGLGSPFFADFVLFHRYLYIDKMICAEREEIPLRMAFNKPYDFVDLRMGEVSDVFPTLDRDAPLFAWLDYDYPICDSIIADLSQLVSLAAPKSVIVATVRAQINWQDGDAGMAKREEVAAELGGLVGRLYGEKITPKDLAQVPLAKIVSTSMRTLLLDAASRRGLSFQQLFNYRYRDGVQMLTVGGIVDESERINHLLTTGVLGDSICYQLDGEPQFLHAPPLTVREKLWLDQHLTDALTAKDVAFEIDEEVFEQFKRYYKYHPSYYEALM